MTPSRILLSCAMLQIYCWFVAIQSRKPTLVELWEHGLWPIDVFGYHLDTYMGSQLYWISTILVSQLALLFSTKLLPHIHMIFRFGYEFCLNFSTSNLLVYHYTLTTTPGLTGQQWVQADDFVPSKTSPNVLCYHAHRNLGGHSFEHEALAILHPMVSLTIPLK